MNGPRKLLLATANPHKAKEMERLLSGLNIQLLTRADFPDLPEVVEDADSFSGNARLKSETLLQATGVTALGDDSGLCVDALDGAPGVWSARFAGEGCSYEDNNQKLIEQLADIPEADRTARFVCVVAISAPGLSTVTFEGVCEGRITTRLQGRDGFGYDPVFLVPDSGRTFAEMDADEKGRISHRGKAFALARNWLENEGADYLKASG